ncbi:winged helix-turn-helix domain-containing protein [Streptomyces albiflavescens]|uniref:winged helix-turn-helix domain-containing protein n=1 Tax=Streptomyces albiflavescens TaxID=1623582 RepID=UPI00166D5CEE|nr:winged helix-turn-helix domain-containing protein [Streptomyces albiflavescens]
MGEERSGEGGGKEFRRVLDDLRNRMVNGDYPLGSSLPAQRLLAEEFEVSRDTVQRVVRTLASEGWVESRQGSGSRVIKTQRIQPAVPQGAKPGPMALGPIISKAFGRSEVSLDVFTLTGESLDTHVRLQALRIRAEPHGAPQRVAVRILVPSEDAELPFPRSKDDPSDRRPVERVWDIARRSASSLRHVLESLRVEKLVPEVSLEIRHTSVVPNFKFYLLNGSEALFGLYQVVERPIFLDDGEELTAVDVEGIGANLMHYERDADPESPGSFFVDSMQTYFNSVWTLLSE